MNIGDLHSKKFWTDSSNDDGWIPITIVLPTGRSHRSTSKFLAISSDALHLPEVCLTLDRVVRDFGFNGVYLNSILDIDMYAMQMDSKSSLDSNMLLMGTPDINPITQALIDKAELKEMNYDVGFSYPYDHLLYGQRGTYRPTQHPFVGLCALFPNLLARRPNRFAFVCGGETATGTISSLLFLLHVIRCKQDAKNNIYNPDLPVKIIDGRPFQYENGMIKHYSDCEPQVDLMNVREFHILE